MAKVFYRWIHSHFITSDDDRTVSIYIEISNAGIIAHECNGITLVSRVIFDIYKYFISTQDRRPLVYSKPISTVISGFCPSRQYYRAGRIIINYKLDKSSVNDVRGNTVLINCSLNIPCSVRKTPIMEWIPRAIVYIPYIFVSMIRTCRIARSLPVSYKIPVRSVGYYIVIYSLHLNGSSGGYSCGILATPVTKVTQAEPLVNGVIPKVVIINGTS